MPEAEYEKVCKRLFAKHDKNKDKVLVLAEFKEFTLGCAEAAGMNKA
jgi:hypothetical protein